VAPLVLLQDAPIPVSRLNPVLDIDGRLYSLQPQMMAAVPRNVLHQPVDNLLRHYDRIIAALDMIFLGF
jgi:toxin CcdB